MAGIIKRMTGVFEVGYMAHGRVASRLEMTLSCCDLSLSLFSRNRIGQS